MQAQGVYIPFRRVHASPGPIVIILCCLLTSASAPAQITTVDDFYPRVAWPSTVAVQGDGNILAGGAIGEIYPYTRWGLGRLFPDGTVDPVYDPNVKWGLTGFNAFPQGELSMVIQGDGKLLVAGDFKQIAGQTCNSIGRLNLDGTRDTTFNPSVTGGYASCLALQPDGKIVVGGSFNQLNGQTCSRIGRLNPNGTTDITFNSSVLGALIYSMALQPDGKVVIGGSFTNILGQSRTNIGRLNADGTLDVAFNPQMMIQAPQLSIAIQPDGKILAGTSLQRLYPDGTFDTNFFMNTRAASSTYSFALQADGKIFVCGSFLLLNGSLSTLPGIGRLNPDGTADNSFRPPDRIWFGNPTIYGTALQVDGKLLVAGSLTYKTGAGLLRFNATGPATQNLEFDGSTITWQRGGTSPEVWRTTFESSADGINWVMLGAGARIAGGWQLTGASVPANSKVRARGYVLGGFANASGWIAESIWPKVRPSIFVDDRNGIGGTNGFGLKVVGTPGEIVVVDASTNLSSWTPVVTNTLCSAPAYFCDPAITNFPTRSYRARLQ